MASSSSTVIVGRVLCQYNGTPAFSSSALVMSKSWIILHSSYHENMFNLSLQQSSLLYQAWFLAAVFILKNRKSSSSTVVLMKFGIFILWLVSSNSGEILNEIPHVQSSWQFGIFIHHSWNNKSLHLIYSHNKVLRLPHLQSSWQSLASSSSTEIKINLPSSSSKVIITDWCLPLQQSS